MTKGEVGPKGEKGDKGDGPFVPKGPIGKYVTIPRAMTDNRNLYEYKNNTII